MKLRIFILGFLVIVSSSLVAGQKNDVMKAQDVLKQKGYDPGPADGALGNRTEQALKNFQRDNGLPITGKLDPVTIEKLSLHSGDGNAATANTLPKPSGMLPKADTVVVCSEGSCLHMGAIEFSINPGGTLQNKGDGQKAIWIWRTIAPEEQSTLKKLGVQTGTAYLVKTEKPLSVTFVSKVDLKLTDDELADLFGVKSK